MSIIHSFDLESKAMISPSDCCKRVDYDIKVLILNFSYQIEAALKEDGLLEELPGAAVKSINGDFPIYRIKNTQIATIKAPITGPMVVGTIEEACYSLGVKKLVLFGSCGALDKELMAGKLVVPSYAYRDEGTSYHYTPASDFIEIKHSKEVCKIFDSLKIDYAYGRIWTTDAIYRETINNVKKKKELGCIAVEMEIAAAEAVCDFRGYELYPFIYSADLLDSSGWDKRILSDIHIDERLKHFYIALEIAKNII